MATKTQPKSKTTPKPKPPLQLSWGDTTFELVDINRIVMTHEQLQSIDAQKATSIAENFKPLLFGALTCFKRKSEILLLKGATRLAALRMSDLDVTDVPVQFRGCYDDNTELAQRTAELILQLDENRRAVLHPIDLFRRAVLANRTREVSILNRLTDRGLHLRSHPGEPRKPRTIDCHATWCRIWDLGNNRLVREVAEFVAPLFVNHITREFHPEVRRASFLMAVAGALLRSGRTATELLAKLRTVADSHLEAVNRLLSRAETVRDGSRRLAIETSLLALLN